MLLNRGFETVQIDRFQFRRNGKGETDENTQFSDLISETSSDETYQEGCSCSQKFSPGRLVYEHKNGRNITVLGINSEVAFRCTRSSAD